MNRNRIIVQLYNCSPLWAAFLADVRNTCPKVPVSTAASSTLKLVAVTSTPMPSVRSPRAKVTLRVVR
jgi:hypothetical protein